jgi:hypothetical protein
MHHNGLQSTKEDAVQLALKVHEMVRFNALKHLTLKSKKIYNLVGSHVGFRLYFVS